MLEDAIHGIYSDRYANPWNTGFPPGPEWFRSHEDAVRRALELNKQFPQFTFFTERPKEAL